MRIRSGVATAVIWLPNLVTGVLIADGGVSGCIDVGRAGLADRYQDIAILWNCLGEFGPHLQSRLLAALGEGSRDRARIDFHLLLDELF